MTVVLWTLVIQFSAYGGGTSLPGFKDRTTCVAAAHWTAKRPSVIDAYCIPVTSRG
jgi:hypothetical protein